jgi:integrase
VLIRLNYVQKCTMSGVGHRLMAAGARGCGTEPAVTIQAQTRALLRGAGRAARAGRADGPQVGVETSFETGDGECTRPGAPVEQVAEGGEVDAGQLTDGTQGASVHRLGDAQRNEPSHLGQRVRGVAVGPVIDEFGGLGSRFLADHEVSVRPRLRLAPQVGPGPSVGGARHDGFYQRSESFRATLETTAEDPVTSAREKYVPKGMSAARWSPIANVTRDVVMRCANVSAYEAGQLMVVVARYFDHQTHIAGLPLDPTVLLRRDIIVAYGNHLSATTAMTDATIGTYRSRLLRVADANIGHLQPTARMPGFRGADGSTPYSDAEVHILRAWVDYQPSEVNRVDFNLLLALCIGAVLRNGEALRVNASHVTVDDEGVLIQVTGDKARTVPVLAEWEAVIADIAAAAWKPDMFLFRPTRAVRTPKVLSDMLHKAPNKPFAINVQRLRATWIVTHLSAETPVQALMDAAGIETLGALGRFYDHVPPMEARTARSALTMRARAEGCRASHSGRPLRAVDDE